VLFEFVLSFCIDIFICLFLNFVLFCLLFLVLVWQKTLQSIWKVLADVHRYIHSSSAIDDMPNRPKHSFTSSFSSHHPEPISCKITESWKLQPVISSSVENVVAPLHRKLSLLFLLMSPSDALGQHSGIHTKDFLSRTRPSLHQVQPAPVRQMRVLVTRAA